MELIDGTCKIEVKLLASGRYVWSVGAVTPLDDGVELATKIKSIDRKLREQFPDYAIRGSSKSVDIEGD